MPNIDDLGRTLSLLDDEAERQNAYVEEVPGHTPGVAEGDDEDAPCRMHPYPDPDKTPGRAEG